jgi:CheY-like chemotaxis protein
MARTVLLIEPDVDELGALASKLRGQGLEVAIADSLESAAERARVSRVDLVLVSGLLANTDDFSERLRSLPELATTPRFVLVDGAPAPNSAELGRSDVEGIAKRIYALTRSVPAAAMGGDFRGDLQQVSVADLLQLLGTNQRSGTLSIVTPSGQGEVRLVNGEIVDAAYRRVDGEKALIRLLGEMEGKFAFAGGTQQTLRRIQRPSHVLLMDGMRQLDEAKRIRDTLAIGQDSLLAVVLPRPDFGDIEQRVLEALLTPRVLNELLDEVPLLDLYVLNGLSSLLERGAVRRFAGGMLRVELGDPERLGLFAVLAKRVARPGFEGPPRIGFAASQQRLMATLPALARISDTSVTTEVPAAPVPYRLATLRLPDGVTLEITGLPLVEAFLPLWTFVLPSCAAIARLDGETSEALEAGCRLASVPLIDGDAVPGGESDAEPERLAALIRLALERAAGGN